MKHLLITILCTLTSVFCSAESKIIYIEGSRAIQFDEEKSKDIITLLTEKNTVPQNCKANGYCRIQVEHLKCERDWSCSFNMEQEGAIVGISLSAEPSEKLRFLLRSFDGIDSLVCDTNGVKYSCLVFPHDYTLSPWNYRPYKRW